MKFPDSLRFFLQPINSEGLAYEYIRRASTVFFVLAGLSLLIGLRGESAGYIDFLVFAGLGTWLRLSNNAVPAGLLLGITLVLLVDSFLGGYFRVRGVLLRLTAIALALRTVEAAIRLPRFRNPRKAPPAPAAPAARPPKPAPPAPVPAPAPPAPRPVVARPPAPAPPLPPPPPPPPPPPRAPAPATSGARPSGGGPVDSSKDIESMEQLKQLGSDMAKPHSPEFLLGFPTEAAALAAAEKVRALQFEQVEVKPAAHGSDWFVHAEKTLLLTEEALRRLRYHFDKIARAGGGYYDGWGAAIER